MRHFRLIIACFSMLMASLPAAAASSAADVEHLHVQLVVPSASLVPGKSADAGLYFKLERGWHVYWKNAGDSGEPPHIKWTLPQGVSAGPLQFPAPQRLPLGPLMDFGYENEVLFPFQVKVAPDAAPGPAVLHAKVDWLVCREVCIPGKTELELTRPVAQAGANPSAVQPDAGLFSRLGNDLPKPLPPTDKLGFETTPSGFRLTIETGRRETQASFFPADQDQIENPAPQTVTPNAKGLSLDLKKDANLTAAPSQLRGVIELSGGRAYEITAPQGAPTPASRTSAPNSSVPSGATAPASSAAAAVPTRPASSGAVSKSSPSVNAVPDTSAAGPVKPGLVRIIGLAFLGGIILNLMPCVFPVLFLKGLALIQSGREERHKLRVHGVVYSLGILVSFWALVSVLLGLRTAGAHLGWGFQFQSPVFLFLMAGLLFFLGLSLAGQFEIGLSLTSAGGSLAAKQGYAGSFFTGVLAVIVATPCTAPFMGAAIGYALAASAAVTFAVFTALALGLAAPYVVLTLQPAWTRVLPRPGAWMEVLRQAVAVPIFGTVIWLAWVIAQAYGATLVAVLLISFLLIAVAGWFLGRWPARGWAAGTAGLIAASVIALAVYASHALVTPPTTVNAQAAGGWQPWSETALEKFQSEGRPVFVDFTASWCLSCQVNERVALNQPEVRKAFADANVVLLKADWTQHDEAISQALQKLGRSGVPAYALYSPGQSAPELLPEALTTGIVTGALNRLPRTTTSSVALTANSK